MKAKLIIGLGAALLASIAIAAIAAVASLTLTRPAPEVKFSTLAGDTFSTSELRGKVVLVNFWATWCDPCRAEMPAMNKLRASLAGRPFAVLAVNLAESESRIRRFMEQVPLEFVVLLDRDSGAAKAWKARVLPVSFVLDAGGRIRYSALGEIDWAQDGVRKAILALMPREATPPRAALSASSP